MPTFVATATKTAYASGMKKVFLSWSGERSGAAAMALREWLPLVLQGTQPWMSVRDVEAGARWGRLVEEQLSDSQFGIICLTRGNQSAPWLLFEAGALAKTVADSFVCPYLLDLEPWEIQQPLAQFQAKRADETGTLDLLKAINMAFEESALSEKNLLRTFEHWWPDLQSRLRMLPPDTTASRPSQRTLPNMIDEILVSVREMRRLGDDEAAWRRRVENHIASTGLPNANVAMRNQPEAEACTATVSERPADVSEPDYADNSDQQWLTDPDGGAGS